ncbi:MAG: RdgB/HAM1 family non-canonical purine NTP pyrophosphatase, partial [Coxiellaceae bacterium]|nr:RdgB/HAM1 family non-canonical purine NTP pyrophosphatase [Coxiellaceae bacterium]
IKARHASQVSGLPAMADDSGLSIDALNGAPGVYSARYAGENANDLDRINKVLSELKNVPKQKRQAQFHCAIALVQSADDEHPIVCEGIWPGLILNEPRGDKGFGYDPIFFVPEKNCSAAELDPVLKNQMSHRGRAMEQFRALLITEID